MLTLQLVTVFQTNFQLQVKVLTIETEPNLLPCVTQKQRDKAKRTKINFPPI